MKVIARKPHPIGSIANREVREYLVQQLKALGLEPAIQATTVNRGRKIAYVENIVARMNGVNNSKAILVLSHYDTVPDAPGASDDGASNAAMLETARALVASSPLKNDVLFLFTDGEEEGLLGALAFVNEHPYINEIGLVLNFDNKGHTGPVILYETSDRNGKIIAEFAKVAPQPVGTSWASEVKKLLPTSTDFVLFQYESIPGLNFAYIGGDTHYHRAIDNLENIDQRSLQHLGITMLQTIKHFGQLDLNNLQNNNAIYFNFMGVLIHYPASWAIHLMILAIAVFIILFTYGLKSGSLKLSKVVIGLVIFLLTLAISSGSIFLIWKLIRLIHPDYTSLGANTYNRDSYFAAFSFLSIALFTFVYSLIKKKIGDQNFLMGILGCWLLLTIASSLYVPGFSFMLFIPFMFGIACYWFMIRLQKKAGWYYPGIVSGLTVPAIFIYMPSIYLVSVALGLNLSLVPNLLLLLLLSSLVPHLSLLSNLNRWLLPIVASGLSILFLIIGSLTSHFDKHHPKPAPLRYVVDLDEERAYFVSSRNVSDEWYSQFIDSRIERTHLEKFNLSNVAISEAPYFVTSRSELKMIEDTFVEGMRQLKFKLFELNKIVEVVVNNPGIVELKVARKTIKPLDNQYSFFYLGINEEGIDVEMKTKSREEFTIKVLTNENKDLTMIPELKLEPLPEYLIPHRNVITVGKTFNIPAQRKD